MRGLRGLEDLSGRGKVKGSVMIKKKTGENGGRSKEGYKIGIIPESREEEGGTGNRE